MSVAIASDPSALPGNQALPWLALWTPRFELAPRGLRIGNARRFAWVEASDGARWCAAIAAPVLHREPANHAQGRPALVVAVQGHVLVEGGCVALEGADAAQVIWSIHRRHGIDGFAALSGNFAFVVVDPSQGLWLVRDAAGCKPLFRAETADGVRIAGGSAIDVARACGGPLRCDEKARRQFLDSGRPPLVDRTLLAGVRVFPPGQATGWLGTGAEAQIVQRAAAQATAASCSIESAAEAWMARMIATCAAQSAAGDTGVALSGGMDSSGLLVALQAAGRTGIPCFTFCHDREDLPSQWHERAYAHAAARHCDARLHAVTMDAAEVASMLEPVARRQDFPFGSPVALVQSRLVEVAAANCVRRLLTGHGPDTLLGGGDSQLIARAGELLARLRFGAVWRLLRGARPYSNLGTAHVFAAALMTLRPGLASRGVLGHVEAQLYRDVVPVSLQIEECNARALGIDNRSPYLVRESIEFALGLDPDVMLAPDGRTKAVMRRALSGRAPAQIVARKRAIGFAVPVLPWLLESERWLRGWLDAASDLGVTQTPSYSRLLPVLRRGDAHAWQAAFQTWRHISLAAWMQAHDVRA